MYPNIHGQSGKTFQKRFVHIKHFLEPIYQIKIYIFFHFLEGGGLPPSGKISTFFS